ncbi:MAG: glycosyl transferase, family 2, partial [Bryobacterales bacterium]|nr:glycosyl transferase, family 2 [Bryobacterales bacterium]
SRYFTGEQLDAMVQTNYLRFVASAISSPVLFRRLWLQAIRRLHLAGNEQALRGAALLPWKHRRREAAVMDEEQLLALTNGDVAVFPGRARGAGATVLVATPYLPFPLSHGGAVRMFNLMRHAARERAQVLVAFCDVLAAPPEELLEICAEIVLVRRVGTHYRKTTDRPDTVEEFDSAAFHAALRQTVRKWRPAIAQLEFTQMAQYAGDCRPAKTILVEHDITFDLQEQLLRRSPGDWELERQLHRWRAFETAAWSKVDCVVTVSEKDRKAVGAKAVCIPNGVDTERFKRQATENDGLSHWLAQAAENDNGLLFVGSFAHLPNVLAIEFFLAEIWPLLEGVSLHIIGGIPHEKFEGPRIHVEGFVADVRPAYAAASVVIAPLTASAGTNIKILEAMAMGKAIVSTTAGINGLDLAHGRELLVADEPAAFAEAIRRLLRDRAAIERAAREAALRFDWAAIAREQNRLYQRLTGERSD